MVYHKAHCYNISPMIANKCCSRHRFSNLLEITNAYTLVSPVLLAIMICLSVHNTKISRTRSQEANTIIAHYDGVTGNRRELDRSYENDELSFVFGIAHF